MLWLQYAQNLDRTNTQIHESIAERKFLHAQQKNRKGDNAEVLKALDESLWFNHDHTEAKSLREAILREVKTP